MTSTKRHPKTTERIAYHEAAHAIVAHHFGVEFPEITISPNYERLKQGEILLKRKAHTLREALLMRLGVGQPQHLRESLVIMTAGIAAVMLIRKRVSLRHHKEAWVDMKVAHKAAKKLGYGDIEESAASSSRSQK